MKRGVAYNQEASDAKRGVNGVVTWGGPTAAAEDWGCGGGGRERRMMGRVGRTDGGAGRAEGRGYWIGYVESGARSKAQIRCLVLGLLVRWTPLAVTTVLDGPAKYALYELEFFNIFFKIILQKYTV
jgi:hypothetical protein